MRDPRKILPGIGDYPDLLSRFESELRNLKDGCNRCDRSACIAKFASLMERRRRENKHRKRKQG